MGGRRRRARDFALIADGRELTDLPMGGRLRAFSIPSGHPRTSDFGRPARGLDSLAQVDHQGSPNMGAPRQAETNSSASSGVEERKAAAANVADPMDSGGPSGRNQSILFHHALHPVSGFMLRDEGTTSSSRARKIHVVLDEAFDPFTAVCAVVFTDQEFEAVNARIAALRADLGESGYLAALASYKKFLTNGFHATDDTAEVSVRFIDEAYKHLPGKAFIYYTDGQRRRDLSAKKTILLLYACVIQVILLNHKDSVEVHLHFERHQQLQRYYPHIGELAARRARTRSEVTVEVCGKGEPPSLALADYVLHIFGQSIQYIAYGHRPAEKYQYRNLIAIKNHVSLIYSMEHGRVASRRSRW